MVFALNPQINFAQPVSVVNKNENGAAYYYHDSKNFITSNVPLNELNVKAYRHFEKNYPGIDNETWTKIINDTVVIFKSNTAFCKIFYNTKGDFVYSYIYYDEKNCFAELANRIDDIYLRYKVIRVIELFDRDKSVFGINISNGEITKSLEMKNGELKFLNEYRNQ